MDDEAFALMLQQQLEEEARLEEQHQSQEQAMQPHAGNHFSTKAEQEEEDARMARLIAQQSLMNLNVEEPPASAEQSTDSFVVSRSASSQGGNSFSNSREFDAKPPPQELVQPVGLASPNGLAQTAQASTPVFNEGVATAAGFQRSTPQPTPADDEDQTPSKKKDKKKKRGVLGRFGRSRSDDSAKSQISERSSSQDPPMVMDIPGGTSMPNLSSIGLDGSVVRFPIPKPVAHPQDALGAPKGPLPYSLSVSRHAPELPEATVKKRSQMSMKRNTTVCVVCKDAVRNPISALDKKYHPDCFRCSNCHEVIDPTSSFTFTSKDGEKQPMHRQCFTNVFAIKCAVCKDSIPPNPSGKIVYVRHPFFDSEQMCPSHARSMTRRCTGCHRFEPQNQPFAELNDVGRCVCFSCCRSVVVDSQDAMPLWSKVITFFEEKLNLPIWKDMREIPILIVGYNSLNDQMNNTSNVHGGSSQIMTRGLCLTEHESGRRFRMNRMKFNKNNQSFMNCDVEDRGFTYFQVPDASKVNPDASVTAILCLSGLPRDLTASVLAHEATHAWIKLHPQFRFEKPIPPHVEEGCAQLIALLFLNDGLDPPLPFDNIDGDSGPSDEKLRQYFKFNIETDDHEIYGSGYRRAAVAYSMIGIEALMSHVVLYQDFPTT